MEVEGEVVQMLGETVVVVEREGLGFVEEEGVVAVVVAYGHFAVSLEVMVAEI